MGRQQPFSKKVVARKTVLRPLVSYKLGRLFFPAVFILPIQRTGGTGINTCTTFGTAGWESFVKRRGYRGQETPVLGTQQRFADQLFAGLYANTAFDTFAGILNDFRMTRIDAFGIFSAADGIDTSSAEFGTLLESAIVFVAA